MFLDPSHLIGHRSLYATQKRKNECYVGVMPKVWASQAKRASFRVHFVCSPPSFFPCTYRRNYTRRGKNHHRLLPLSHHFQPLPIFSRLTSSFVLISSLLRIQSSFPLIILPPGRWSHRANFPLKIQDVPLYPSLIGIRDYHTSWGNSKGKLLPWFKLETSLCRKKNGGFGLFLNVVLVLQ